MVKRRILIIALIAIFTLPIYVKVIISPAFSKLFIETSEKEAVMIASHMASMHLPVNEELKTDSLPVDFHNKIKKLSEEFNIMKIKVFSPKGKTLYSTDLDEIGKINQGAEFHTIVAKGKAYSKLKKKNTKSVEGQTLISDVVETYVPIMNEKKFIGAIEAYYDVTQKNKMLNKLTFRSSLISFALMFVFFILIVVILFKVDRPVTGFQQEGLHAIYRSPYYVLIITAISIFVAESVVMIFISTFSNISMLEEAVLDSSLLVLLVSPVLLFFIFRPLIQHISERKIIEERLRTTSTSDDLTGLLNRRGFFNLAEQQLKTAKRLKKELILLYADVDNLKRINDVIGHSQGDLVLVETAQLFRMTFRESDIIARLGGDEFVALSTGEIESDEETVRRRLQESLQNLNKQRDHSYNLSISIGVVRCEPDELTSIDELIKQADDLMYKEKKTRKEL
jgi:diguanylate cyclase (GGDEF)-like protein